MRKNTFLATLALFIAAVGVIIALAAYFKNRSSYLFDDDDDYLFDDDDDFDYYPDAEDGGDEDPAEDAADI
jgi:hypothetical protein